MDEVHETTRAVYGFVRDYMIAHKGTAPTNREIGRGVRPELPLSSSLVFYHLNKLASLGVIQRDSGDSRAIRLVGGVYSPPPAPEWLK